MDTSKGARVKGNNTTKQRRKTKICFPKFLPKGMCIYIGEAGSTKATYHQISGTLFSGESTTKVNPLIH
jgi:hypothetical protein